MIPFITEEIWGMLGKVAPSRGLSDPQPAAESIMIAAWPQVEASHQDATIEQRFAHFQTVLGAVRKIRKTQNIPTKTAIEFRVKCEESIAALLAPMEPYFASMAGAKCTASGPHVEAPAASSQISLPGLDVMVDMQDLIDVDAEFARLKKELEQLTKNIAGKEGKLANANFTDRAPAEIVQRERESLAQLKEQAASIQTAINKLRGTG